MFLPFLSVSGPVCLVAAAWLGRSSKAAHHAQHADEESKSIQKALAKETARAVRDQLGVSFFFSAIFFLLLVGFKGNPKGKRNHLRGTKDEPLIYLQTWRVAFLSLAMLWEVLKGSDACLGMRHILKKPQAATLD